MVRKGLQVVLLCGASLGLKAGVLTPSDGAAGWGFGISADLYDSTVLVGAAGNSISDGRVYVFRGLDAETGAATEVATLKAAGLANSDAFGGGSRTSIWGNMAVIGAARAQVGSNEDQGAAFVFRNLDTVTGTVTESAKLVASDGLNFSSFGGSTSLSGTMAVVGASSQGAAYIFRNLDTATGTVTENARLVASDAAASSFFGSASALSGNLAVVGSYNAKNDTVQTGAAYVYRNLDTATGTVTEAAKLVASDGVSMDRLGASASVSGARALVTASRATVGVNTRQGAVYFYSGLDTATGTVTETAKLVASDGIASAAFGDSLAIDGTVGLVGCSGMTVGGVSGAGEVYLFRDLDMASGTVTENVRIYASGILTANTSFGSSVALDGDQFVIGARGVSSQRGSAFTGSVSSMTTLDEGNTQRTIEGISFITQDDWTIGDATSGNIVALSAGDAAQVVDGRSLYIGKNGGSNNNALALSGSLTAEEVEIGSMAGNVGNALVLNSGSLLTVDTIRLAGGNSIVIEGDYTDLGAFLGYLGSAALNVWDGASWRTADGANVSSLLTASLEADYTRITAVPEPGAVALLSLGLAAVAVAWRRKAAAI